MYVLRGICMPTQVGMSTLKGNVMIYFSGPKGSIPLPEDARKTIESLLRSNLLRDSSSDHMNNEEEDEDKPQPQRITVPERRKMVRSRLLAELNKLLPSRQHRLHNVMYYHKPYDSHCPPAWRQANFPRSAWKASASWSHVRMVPLAVPRARPTS